MDKDPHAGDPFFARVLDSQWNACIGQQGYEENYVDGYIEAAIELANAIIEKGLIAERDTLVLPILYNSRHAIELALKFSTRRLIAAGVIKDDGRKPNHNIRLHWERLDNAAIGDKTLRRTIAGLKPFAESLSKVDSDGQELRYHQNRDEDQSLSKFAIANLRLIRDSLLSLESLIATLKNRTVEFIEERHSGTYTNHCSRKDLLAITHLLPLRDSWNSEAFEVQKAIVKNDYGLSNKQFSLALDEIQGSREMRALLGVESALIHLSDADILWTAEQWRKLHPIQEAQEGEIAVDYFDPQRFDGMAERLVLRRHVVASIQERLVAEALAELEAIFYLGRDTTFIEYFEDSISRNINQYAVPDRAQKAILHLLDKTNFVQCLSTALPRLGRLTIAEKLTLI